ncbi:hypothetical protein D3C76_1760800 [compost metagenome]
MGQLSAHIVHIGFPLVDAQHLITEAHQFLGQTGAEPAQTDHRILHFLHVMLLVLLPGSWKPPACCDML